MTRIFLALNGLPTSKIYVCVLGRFRMSAVLLVRDVLTYTFRHFFSKT